MRTCSLFKYVTDSQFQNFVSWAQPRSALQRTQVQAKLSSQQLAEETRGALQNISAVCQHHWHVYRAAPPRRLHRVRRYSHVPCVPAHAVQARAALRLLHPGRRQPSSSCPRVRGDTGIFPYRQHLLLFQISGVVFELCRCDQLQVAARSLSVHVAAKAYSHSGSGIRSQCGWRAREHLHGAQ